MCYDATNESDRAEGRKAPLCTSWLPAFQREVPNGAERSGFWHGEGT